MLAGLLARERTGTGQAAETSLLGAGIWLQATQVAMRAMTGEDLPRPARADAGNPLWNSYRCADGEWLYLCMPPADFYWRCLSQAAGLEYLEQDQRFSTLNARIENHKELVLILDRVFATRTRAQWTAAFCQDPDLIWSPVNRMSDLLEDPQVVENGYILEYEHPVCGRTNVLGCPVSFAGADVRPPGPAPELGEHTEEVLIEVAGYTREEIAGLRETGVI